ncbi:hypothetical protein C8J56DRAFT_891992 [Mycena floridula]|nr:hypothetical protein C8J56DRAFT_891992 [Mycena floridula]
MQRGQAIQSSSRPSAARLSLPPKLAGLFRTPKQWEMAHFVIHSSSKAWVYISQSEEITEVTGSLRPARTNHRLCIMVEFKHVLSGCFGGFKIYIADRQGYIRIFVRFLWKLSAWTSYSGFEEGHVTTLNFNHPTQCAKLRGIPDDLYWGHIYHRQSLPQLAVPVCCYPGLAGFEHQKQGRSVLGNVSSVGALMFLDSELLLVCYRQSAPMNQQGFHWKGPALNRHLTRRPYCHSVMVTVTPWLDQSNITPRLKKGQHSEHIREPIMKEPKRIAMGLSSVDKLQCQPMAKVYGSDNMSFSSPEESNALAPRCHLMSIYQADRKLRQLLHGPSAEYFEWLVLQCSRQPEDSKAVKLVQDHLDSVQAIVDNAEDACAGLLKLLGPYSTDFQTANSIVHGIHQFIRELVDIGGYCMSGIEELGDAYEQSTLLYQG